MIWFIIGIFILLVATEICLKLFVSPILKIIDENELTHKFSDGIVLSLVGGACIITAMIVTTLSYLILILHGWVL